MDPEKPKNPGLANPGLAAYLFTAAQK